jgi:hypothetical protein
MLVRTFVYFAETYFSSFQEPTKEVWDKMVGDVGMLPPLLTKQLSNLWCSRNKSSKFLRRDGYQLRTNINAFEEARGVGRPRIGTHCCQSVSQILCNIKHDLSNEFPKNQSVVHKSGPETAVHRSH